MAMDINKDLKILFSVMVRTGSRAGHQQKINMYLKQPLDYQNQITMNRNGLILESKTEVIEYIYNSKFDGAVMTRKKK
jgi:hypothetical protein